MFCWSSVVVGVSVLGAMMVQAAVAQGFRSSDRTQVAAGSVVPLTVCPTKFGVSFGKSAVFPSLTTLSISTPLASSLAAYTDTQGLMTVIGPRGWKCSASYGADGSGGVTVFPRGSSATSPVEGIVAGETSACYGCTTGQACALFPTAEEAFQAAYRYACPAHRPPRESIYRLSKTVVAFEDPSYVKGEGALSGGQFPANGVMTYLSGSNDGSWVETCTLPDNVHSTCTAVLNDFVAKYQNR